jgi:hypothetical protein
MPNENIIHVKFEKKEGLISKENLLNLELQFLNTLKLIKEYHGLRKIELKKRIEINKIIKKINANLNKLNRIMPKLKNKKSHETSITYSFTQKTKEDGLEYQLEEIQKRLKAIQARF